MTKTLEQMSQTLRDAVNGASAGIDLDELADTIDMHLAAMLYTAPPINLAAVRDVIADMRQEALVLDHDRESQEYLREMVSKLEAAIKGGM